MPSSVPPSCSALFTYTTLFRSICLGDAADLGRCAVGTVVVDIHHLPGDAVQRGVQPGDQRRDVGALIVAGHHHGQRRSAARDGGEDRKSTRLNSSHMSISYAVFCTAILFRTLYLHDALPIYLPGRCGGPRPLCRRDCCRRHTPPPRRCRTARRPAWRSAARRWGAHCSRAPPRSASERRARRWGRSEEHTSELQSHVNLVCRLLYRHLVPHSLPTRRSSDLSAWAMRRTSAVVPSGLLSSTYTTSQAMPYSAASSLAISGATLGRSL